MYYSFKIVPLVGVTIQGVSLGAGALRVEASGYTQADVLPSTATATFKLDGDLLGIAHADQNQTPYDSFSYDHWVVALSNYEYRVYIEASTAAIGGELDGERMAQAKVDPIFTLRDDLQSDYVIQYSPGLVDASTTDVPEPSTWASLVGGLVALACLRRRVAE